MNVYKSRKTTSLIDRYFAFLRRRSVGDRFIFYILLITTVVSLFVVLQKINTNLITTVPTTGGTLVEGIVGTPRFVNPVLAITRADHDMVALVYSGLLKLDENGTLVPDLAKSIDVSEDGRIYNVKLRDDIFFHNGDKLTARDVAYTITLIQNTDLKSPLQGNWDGVLVEELGEYELNIVLEEPYPPFMENLTVGILPRDLWDTLPTEQLPFSQNNTMPVGTGPYKIADVLRNKSGLVNAYKLISVDDRPQQANISTLVFNFYQNENELRQALQNKDIASTPSISPKNLSNIDTDVYAVLSTPLPRTFSIFFNQNRSAALRDNAVRKALNIAIDKQELIDAVLFGYGIPIDTPVPPSFAGVKSTSATNTQNNFNPEERIDQAKNILQNGGWEQNDAGLWQKEIDGAPTTLEITLTTSNTPLFDATATYVQSQWEALGVRVQVDQFEQTDLVQSIIRPRSFQALLFGNDIGRAVNIYPFWHSSQKNDPGLNIAQYANIDSDALLEKIRTESDTQKRSEYIAQFNEIVASELPAIFLFAPTFNYVLDTRVVPTSFTQLSKPSERFANIAQWYMTSSNLWPVFTAK